MSRSWGDGNGNPVAPQGGDVHDSAVTGDTRYMSLANPLRLTKLEEGPPNGS